MFGRYTENVIHCPSISIVGSGVLHQSSEYGIHLLCGCEIEVQQWPVIMALQQTKINDVAVGIILIPCIISTCENNKFFDAEIYEILVEYSYTRRILS